MATLPVLVLNSGSSSIKFSFYEAGDGQRITLFEGTVDGIGTDLGKFWIKDASGTRLVDQSPALPNREVAFKLLADAIGKPPFPKPQAIGHRMVAGGPHLTQHQLITPGVLAEMEKCIAFAPLHSPIAIYIMQQASQLFPGVPNFVCFDSAFHTTIPEAAARFAIPEPYVEQGVRRYGAHGISYESTVLQLGRDMPSRLIACHLGNGASITAILNGRSIDTSMGLTPTGGIISGTRTGDIDPGVLLYILRDIAPQFPDTVSAANQLETIVARKSGLLGVSRRSNDMRDIRENLLRGCPNCNLAVSEFTYVIRKFIGAYIAVLGGLDMLVFTGGIGENDIQTRIDVCASLGHFGIQLDLARNNVRGAAIVSAENSEVEIRVIPAAEDLVIVNHICRLLEQQRKP
jgi:acetate kinase